MPRGCQRFRPGFTLLEIIAVLVVLGLITLTAVMTLDNTDYNLLSQAQAIRQDIRYAQSMAMKTGSVWGVDSNGVSFRAFEMVNNVATDRSFPGKETPVQLSDLGVSLSSFTLYFNGFGQPANAAGNTPAATLREIKVGPGGWDFTEPTDPPNLVKFNVLPDTGFIEVQ